MQSAFVDLILCHHLIIRNSESYSENLGFINNGDKKVINCGNLCLPAPPMTWGHVAQFGDLMWLTLAGSAELTMLKGETGQLCLKLFVCVCVCTQAHTGKWVLIQEDIHGQQ